jgi:single-strand DNA-binding protein
MYDDVQFLGLDVMGYSVNKVILLGYLGKDPEVRRVSENFVVAEMRLATTDRIKDKAGNYKDETEWHSLIAINKSAEFCGKYLKKGMRLYVEGKKKTREWEDKTTGQTRSKVEIQVQEIVIASDGDGPKKESTTSDWGEFGGL